MYHRLLSEMLSCTRLCRGLVSCRLSFVPRSQSQCMDVRTFSSRHGEHLNGDTSQSQYGYTRRRTDAWPKEDLAVLPERLRPDKAETLDLILRQKVYLLQARRGYRVNTDSVLLPFFATEVLFRSMSNVRKPLRVLELGAGVGLVSILFAKANGPCQVQLVELQGQLANRAKRNLELNDVSGDVLHHDLRDGFLPRKLWGQFDVVLINPPFYRPENRVLPKLRERFLAQIETSAIFSDFLSAAHSACDCGNPDSFVAVIHDRKELPRLREAFPANGFIAVHSREMKHRDAEEPTRILVQLRPQTCGSPPPPKPITMFSLTRDIKRHRTCDTVRKEIPSMPVLCLKPGSTPDNEYNQSIERFLDKLPLPSLRIGRLRQN